MNQPIRNLLLSLSIPACFMLLPACKCHDDTHSLLYPEITGDWQCQRFSGGFAGIDSNVSDKAWYLSLKADGSYKEDRQAQTISQGTYSIYHSSGNVYAIHFSQESIDQTIYTGHDTLVLTDDLNDGFSYIYTRK